MTWREFMTQQRQDRGRVLRETLQQCNGSVPEAARQLGINRTTIYALLATYGVRSRGTQNRGSWDNPLPTHFP